MKTSHDLSYNSGKINLPELKRTIGRSCKNARWLVEGSLSTIQHNLIKGVNSNIVSEAHKLAEFSADYANALETYQFLSELENRENITIEKEG